jgi:hypothetical protein
MQRVGYVKRLRTIGIFIDSRHSRYAWIAPRSTTNRGTYHQARKAVFPTADEHEYSLMKTKPDR